MKSGINVEQRDILIVPFPLSDLSSVKKRPVLVLSNSIENKLNEDILVCQITSRLKEEKYSIIIDNQNLEQGKLPLKSRIKVNRLITISKEIVIKKIAKLNCTTYSNVIEKLVGLVKGKAKYFNPKINVDILVAKKNRILLGLLTKKWSYNGKQVYGVPGRDIRFGEKISDTVKRNIKQEFDCNVTNYRIICVNANYALGNHYIGIGVIAEIDGEPKVLIPEEWEKWEWFTKDTIPKNLFPATKNLIESYFNNKTCVSE
ncbi:type II toxin-antitoxin system PemK/MazF family toxin [Candidatus Woesearchaeota archaeon]|nr:type II toxin-antitoxin system PemK/MazF family toxin [Candidatus Woesearchaeota archaeon]